MGYRIMDWIDPTKDGDIWLDFVNVAMNILFS